jgi:plastocyanin
MYCFSFLILKMMKNLNNSKSKLVAGFSILVLSLLILGSCNKSTAYNTPSTGGTGGTGGSGGPGTNEVFIQGMAFTPASITITAGTTITWTNKDAIGHTVTSNTNLFNSGTLSTGGTFSFTFAKAGTYSYYCSIHPSMVGSVIVN